MPTLILTPRFTEDSQSLWRAAGRLGWNVERLTGWRVSPQLRSADEPILYLEGLLAPTIAAELGLQLLESPVDWLPRLPLEYRKRHIELATLGKARLQPDPAFIKPPNEKSFAAGIYRGSQLPTEFSDDTPVLVAEVVNWEKEFRCFILDRRIKTLSVYLRAGELQRASDFAQTDEEVQQATHFLDSLLSDPRVELPRATVIDVGVITGRGWAVVEQNAAWGAGIYGCDPDQVLEVIRCAVSPAIKP